LRRMWEVVEGVLVKQVRLIEEEDRVDPFRPNPSTWLDTEKKTPAALGVGRQAQRETQLSVEVTGGPG